MKIQLRYLSPSIQGFRLQTKLSLSTLFSLFSFLCFAQDYEYQWAKSGGGSQSTSGDAFNERLDETIRDVVVDANNNSYFLANLQAGNNNFEGISLTHYGQNDILILALDCEGNFLWHHTIGGSSEDQAYKLGLDSMNGLYVSVNIHNKAYIDNNGNEQFFPPVHFSEDDVMPLIPNNTEISHEGYKKGFLLKFDKNTGDLLWRKDLQGLVSQIAGLRITTGRIFIDSSDIIHQIVGLSEGTHLDGLVTVTEINPQFFLVKYDTDGNILGIPQQLPMTSGSGAGFNHDNTFFEYDEQLNRYYIAGMSAFFQPLSYGGISLQESGFYILAFDGTTFAELWRRELLGNPYMNYEEIKGMAIDENSNIYLAGKYSFVDTVDVFFGDYQLPGNIGTTTTANTAYILKLNSSGTVQWVRVPDGWTSIIPITGLPSTTGTFYNRGIVLNGNEVASLPGGSYIWGDFSLDRPVGHQSDPAILRLDKETGEVIGLHDIMGGSGNHNEFRVITTDNDGNYIAGGHFFGALEHPVTGESMYGMGKTDFFMAKLSAYVCGSGSPGNPCEEIELPSGDTSQEVQVGMTLADLQVEGENLQWYADAELTEPLSETHIVENNTTYYVTQTIGVCSGETALAVTVTTQGTNPCQGVVVPVPTGNSTQEVQAGMTLADLQVAGENLQWYADADLTEPLSENHFVENNTTYYVTQTVGFCTSEALAVEVTTLGISDFQMIQIKLYPNPTGGLLYIESTQEVQSYEVYNLIGQRLLSGDFTGSIDMQEVSKGTYIIRFTTPTGAVFTEKVIKE